VVIQPQDFPRWLSADEKVEDLLHAPVDDFWAMEKIASPRSKKAEPASAPPVKSQMDLF